MKLPLASRYIPEPMSGCWLWLGHVRKRGYGSANTHGETQAHRMMWVVHNGPIPDKLNVLHRCDVKCCVNPDHLFLGGQSENTHDAIKKGLMKPKRGEVHPRAKLSEAEVRAIREDRRPCRKIAAEYGVGPTTVIYIKNRKNWRSLP